jgi:hypothetical protein
MAFAAPGAVGTEMAIMRSFWLAISLAVIVLSAHARAAHAQVQEQGVQTGGVNAILIKPKSPRASVILLAGGDGRLGIDSNGDFSALKGNLLVRTRAAYAARGFAVLVPDYGFDLSALVAYMSRIKRPVAVVGTSRGTLRAAQGIAAGAHPDRLVLTSGFLSEDSGSSENVVNILGTPADLPPTLIVHHRQDGCGKTQPAGVAPFIAWAHGKAKVIWLSGGEESGNPCGAEGHHGFAGIDGQVVSTVSAFVR